jgi:hypothetical protein
MVFFRNGNFLVERYGCFSVTEKTSDDAIRTFSRQKLARFLVFLGCSDKKRSHSAFSRGNQ